MRRIVAFLVAAMATGLPAAAQQAGNLVSGGLGDGSVLAPPALPSLLPGGLPLPNLPAEAQQEILQRLRDAAAGRTPPMAGPLPAPSAPSSGAPPVGAPPGLPPAAAPPAYGTASGPAAPAGNEPLSNTEAFFAGRLGLVLRQFGYDSFSIMRRKNPKDA